MMMPLPGDVRVLLLLLPPPLRQHDFVKVCREIVSVRVIESISKLAPAMCDVLHITSDEGGAEQLGSTTSIAATATSPSAIV